jgi:hypothetical protein
MALLKSIWYKIGWASELSQASALVPAQFLCAADRSDARRR